MNRLVVTLIFVFGASTLSAQEMPPAQVEVIKVEEHTMSPTMELQGNVVSLQDSVVSAQVEGQLEFIKSIGTLFEKDEVIAIQDADRLIWNVQRQAATLAALKSDLVFRQSEVERFQELARQDNASKTQLQLELSRKERLVNDIKVAEANLAEAKDRLSDSEVKAPFAGVLAMRHAKVGEYISVGEPLVRLVDLETIDVSVATPMRILPLLKEGEAVNVLDNGNQLKLPIRKIVPVGDLSSRMFEVRLDARESKLNVGAAVKVLMPKAPTQTVIAIPRDALVIRGTQMFVYKVNESGQAEQLPANISFAVGNLIAVQSDLQVGDNLIIRGAERLMPGQSVTF